MGTDWDGEDYQRRFDELVAAGEDVHGEATFIRSFGPDSVLDAGCGTGRVAIELARHGLDVVGVDVDASMLETARTRAPEVPWIEADLCDLDLDRRFDAVVMAGNVPLFARPGTQGALVEALADHVTAGGVLVAGFSTDWSERPYSTEEHEAHCSAAGLVPAERFSTWERAPWTPRSNYAVCVARQSD